MAMLRVNRLWVVRSVCVTAFVLASGVALCAPEEDPSGEGTGSREPVTQEAPPTSGDEAAAEEQPPVALEQVYKSVDAKGNVVFTDSPPADKPSEAVTIQPANTMPLGTSRLPQEPRYGDTGESGEGDKKAAVSYTRLEITGPTNDDVFGQDVDSVTIAAVLEPGLQDGHTVQLYFNGNPVGTGSLSETVSPLERGTHTVQAKVFDASGKLVLESSIVQFHVRRTTAKKVSDNDTAPAKPTGMLATLLGRSQPKPPVDIPSGFGSMKGFGSGSAPASAGGTKSGGGVGAASDIRPSKGVP